MHFRVHFKELNGEGVFNNATESVPDGTPEGARNYALSNLHKNLQCDVFEFTLMSILELRLSCTSGCTCWSTHQYTKMHKAIHQTVDMTVHYNV